MGWIRQRVKSFIRSWLGDDYSLVHETQRGDINHQYVFGERDDTIRAQHMRWKGRNESTIRFYLSQYPEDAEYAWASLVEDTIHELSHWAMDQEENSSVTGDGGIHSIKWRRVILSEIVYCHDNIEIEFE